MDAQLKDEISAAVTLAVASECEEHAVVLARLRDQVIDLSAKVTLIETEVLAMIARNQSIVMSVAEVSADAKRVADEAKTEALAMVTSATAHLGSQMDTLASELTSVSLSSKATETAVADLKENIEQSVLLALQKHTMRIETAANELAKTPQVRTAAAVGGTFAGSALVTIGIELAKHFF